MGCATRLCPALGGVVRDMHRDDASQSNHGQGIIRKRPVCPRLPRVICAKDILALHCALTRVKRENLMFEKIETFL
jgi:hypothetical protein